MQFTMQAESILQVLKLQINSIEIDKKKQCSLQELTRKVVEKEEGIHHHSEADHVDHDSEDEHTPSTFSKIYFWY